MCYASIPSVEVGQVTTCAVDNLMKSTYFCANPTFGFFPKLGPFWEYRLMGNRNSPGILGRWGEGILLNEYI